ncbi:MAG: ArgE/DapE family deacylase [Clostridiales bacterium]|nr:ArgE/DapE family deacylase [Clostridiales bacterium]
MDLLKDLIRIDSSTREMANTAIEYASEYLRQQGLDGKILNNNGFKSYIATIGKGDKTLVLNGHLDVVSGKVSQFDPIESDGKIIGRGSADMKGGCAAMIQAMIELKAEDLKSKIMLQLVPDEEVGGMHGSAYLVEQGYVGDFVICAEPTNLQISIQSKGIIRLDVVSTGVSAHGSRPWEGDNAILKAIENYFKIEKLPIINIGSDFYEKSSINLARISGGDIYNRVPDKSTIGLDIRYVPHLNPDQIIEDIKKVVDGEVMVKIIEQGVNIKATNPYILQLKESILNIMPEEPIKLAGQHGGSDTRFFAAKGIPAIEFGPKGNFWHGDGEYVETRSINQLKNILIDFARKF